MHYFRGNVGCATGQILLVAAPTTTEAIRRAIQNSQASLRAPSKRYSANPKTVAKWKKPGSIADLPTGPREPKSTVLSVEDEATIVAFRRHTLLQLDDCLYALQATIPHLTRSSLYRCLQRHDISRCQRWKTRRPGSIGSRPIPSATSHRHCRSSYSGRQAVSLRGYRPDFEVRLYRIA